MKNITNLKIFFLSILFLTLFTVISCKKSTDPEPLASNPSSINTMKVPTGFTFETVRNVGVKITTLDNTDVPVRNIRVNVYTDYPENGGRIILSGVTDASGIFSAAYNFPLVYDSMVVGTTAIGFVNFQKVKVAAGYLDCKLGGKQTPVLKSGEPGTFKSTNSIFKPMGTYNSNGVPNLLTSTTAQLNAAMLNDINSNLPVYIDAPTMNHQYFQL